MYISFKNTIIEILFFSGKSKFYFWTTRLRVQLPRNRKISYTSGSREICEKRLLDKSRRQKRHVYGRQIIPKHYPIPFSTFVRDK